jgi:secondary thiamine-phosphate synthase enzyme
MIKEFSVKTTQREQFLDVTHLLAEAVQEAGIREGVVTAFVPHTTAAITINENADPDVTHDMTRFLSKLIPQSVEFKHAEGNSDAHIKTTLVGASERVLVRGGRLLLGTWQGVYFAEFDGPRSRKLLVHVEGV